MKYPVCQRNRSVFPFGRILEDTCARHIGFPYLSGIGTGPSPCLSFQLRDMLDRRSGDLLPLGGYKGYDLG